MMNSAFKMMNSAFKMMNSAFKMMNSAFKMVKSAFEMMALYLKCWNFQELRVVVTQQSATIASIEATAMADVKKRSNECARVDNKMAERKQEVDKRLATFGQLLKLNSEKVRRKR